MDEDEFWDEIGLEDEVGEEDENAELSGFCAKGWFMAVPQFGQNFALPTFAPQFGQYTIFPSKIFPFVYMVA